MAYALELALRHPAGLGLPDLRAGRDPAGHARRLRHQPAAGLDAAAVAADAGRALRLRAGARSWCVRRRDALRRCQVGSGGGFDLHAVRCRADGRHRADHADGRAGRLPALHARAHGRPTAAAGGPACWSAGRAGWCSACSRCWAARCSPTWRSATWCRPSARSTRTRCTSRPTSTCSRTTAGRWRRPRCSSSSRSSRSTSPTPMPARWRGATSSRALTHSHPGRVVWVVFNTLIAFMLMEMNVFEALGRRARASTPTSRSPG